MFPRTTITLAFFCVAAVSVLVLSPTPPRGYNTFDAYGDPLQLNTSSILALVRDLASSRLPDQGYVNIFGFSGWSQSPDGAGGWVQNLDAFGRPLPAPERFAPGALPAASALARSFGLKFGLWHIRGIHRTAAAARLPVKGAPSFTLDQLVDQRATGGGANGSCLWDSDWLGVNGSHPAAQAYYDSVVEALVELGADVIEADCFMCEPCYSAEMELFTRAVRARPEELILYYSPGGGNSPSDSHWVAANQLATFYRTITDFHGGWYDWGGLQQAIFIAGNFTAAGLHGANSTWPDLDMMPMDGEWWTRGNDTVEQGDRGQTIATLWMVGRYPLFSAGAFPLDEKTLSYLTNPRALRLNARTDDPGQPTRIAYEGNCTCTGGAMSCTIPHGNNDHPLLPCLTKWIVPAASAGAGVTALAVINIGEDPGSTNTSFAELGLPVTPAAQYVVTDIWSGVSRIVRGNETITTALRKHASVLLTVELASG